VQKLSGDAAIAPRPADYATGAGRKRRRENPDQTQHTSHCTFATQGNQGSRKKTAKITAHRKSTEWSALEKPVAPLPSPPPAGKYVSWSWRRDLNPRPSDYKSDALPTELRQQIREKDVLSPKPIPLIIARCPGQLFKVSQGELRAQAGYAIAFSNKTVGRSRLNLTRARAKYPPNPPQMLSFHP
jgi:hypothetical protein